MIAGVHGEIELNAISSVTDVELFDNKAGVAVVLTDDKNVRRLAENVMSLKLEEGHCNKPTEMLYTLKFYGANGAELVTVFMPAGNWTGVSGIGKVYYIKDGQVDLLFLGRLGGDTWGRARGGERGEDR